MLLHSLENFRGQTQECHTFSVLSANVFFWNAGRHTGSRYLVFVEKNFLRNKIRIDARTIK